MTTPLDFINNNAATFARCGAVVPTYRTRGDKRYGPYYRVAYRIAGRQCSIYLGRCRELADRARALLAKLQQPRDYRRMRKRADRQRRATLRQIIRRWQQTIRACGLEPRGCDVRGWRRLGIPRIDKTTPFNAAQRAAITLLLAPPAWFTPNPTADPRYWQNPNPVDQHPGDCPCFHAVQRSENGTVPPPPPSCAMVYSLTMLTRPVCRGRDHSCEWPPAQIRT